jgi:aminopeptidase N
VILGTEVFFEGILVHEMAHMWFGDWVSLDSWSEIWRSEGFATYVTSMWSNRFDPVGLENDIAILSQSMKDDPAVFPLNNPPPIAMFGQHSYYDAAVVIHALRQTVGDKAFFDGLRLYFEHYGGSSASDEEFKAVMEEAARVSLDKFFARWFR